VVTKPTGRPRGQPRKPLAERPGRYLYAELEAWVQRAKDDGFSELGAVSTLALVLSADLSPAGNPMGLALTPSRRRQEKGNNAEHHRYRGAHLPLADDLARTLRSFRNDPDAAAWFVPMVAACRLVIDGDLKRAGDARALAASVGEAAHFDAAMAPAMRFWSAVRAATPRF
jgi:hypothetical protein